MSSKSIWKNIRRRKINLKSKLTIISRVIMLWLVLLQGLFIRPKEREYPVNSNRIIRIIFSRRENSPLVIVSTKKASRI